jgi:ATP-dependent exoDNAse (exonuclease V) alpha subunit
VQWRERDNRRRIANRQYATITALSKDNIEVRFDKNAHIVSIPLRDARKVDLGYASTSHAAQGTTVDRVILNVDTKRSAEIVSNRQCLCEPQQTPSRAHLPSAC